MAGNIDQSVQSEEDCRNQSGQAIALIRAFAQWKNFSKGKNETNDHENDSDPAKLGPHPKPIALGMNRAPIAVRSGPKSSKDVFEIAEADSNPGRIVNELKDVGKNLPAKISRDTGVGEIAKMKSFEGLPAKEQQRSQENKQKGNDEREP